LIPGAIEIAEEEQIIILQFFARLCIGANRETVPPDNDPSGEVNERQIAQIVLQRRHRPEYKEKHPQQRSFPRFHRRNRVQRVRFSVYVRHWFIDYINAYY
jgi:hypothetical protein